MGQQLYNINRKYCTCIVIIIRTKKQRYQYQLKRRRVMKILGISFGRVGHNCDIVTKHALMAAQKAGADVKFVNTIHMKIGHCVGCGACGKAKDMGKQIRCVLKDDYLELENEVLEADAIVVAAPIYSIAPVGQMKNFIDRFGAAHDLAAATAEQEKRKKNGAQELLDERIFKQKYVAYISVGGAHTQNWLALGLPNFAMFGMSVCMLPVGMIDGYDMGERTNPVLDPPFLEKVAALGKHLKESVGKKREEIEWFGEKGVCPVCHNNLISVRETTDVECPVCGIKGKLSVEGNKVHVAFSKEEQERARGTINGMWEHYYEIKNMMKVIIPKLEANKDTLPKLMEPYNNFKSTY
jgi:multimeric flavodoxin WrbA